MNKDVWSHILKFLRLSDYFSAISICKEFLKYFDSSYFWRQLYQRDLDSCFKGINPVHVPECLSLRKLEKLSKSDFAKKYTFNLLPLLRQRKKYIRVVSWIDNPPLCIHSDCVLYIYTRVFNTCDETYDLELGKIAPSIADGSTFVTVKNVKKLEIQDESNFCLSKYCGQFPRFVFGHAKENFVRIPPFSYVSFFSRVKVTKTTKKMGRDYYGVIGGWFVDQNHDGYFVRLVQKDSKRSFAILQNRPEGGYFCSNYIRIQFDPLYLQKDGEKQSSSFRSGLLKKINSLKYFTNTGLLSILGKKKMRTKQKKSFIFD